MNFSKMESLKVYRITKGSSDGTFSEGDIIWKSRDGSIAIAGKYGGCINPDELVGQAIDFEAEPREDYTVSCIGGTEILTRK